MRKFFVVLALLCGHLYALDKESTLKLYDGIFAALSPKASISVYTEEKEYMDVFQYSERFLLSDKLEESDILLIAENSTLNNALRTIKANKAIRKKLIIFVTNYQLLSVSEDVVGAFYWRKGRPQLLFIKNRLDKHNVVLPEEYKSFMVNHL